MPLPQRQISGIVCDGGYLDVKVGVFQVQRKELLPWSYLREDLLQCSHSERFDEGAVEVPEIEDGPLAAILFGDEEVLAVSPVLTDLL